MLRNEWTDAWEDPDNPDPLGMPLQFMVTGEAVARGHHYSEQAKDIAFNPVGQIVGTMNKVRRTNTDWHGRGVPRGVRRLALNESAWPSTPERSRFALRHLTPSRVIAERTGGAGHSRLRQPRECSAPVGTSTTVTHTFRVPGAPSHATSHEPPVAR